MSLPFDFHPRVRMEVEKAYRWYEDQQRGLGARFLNALELVKDRIVENPEFYGFAEADVREAPVKRFPFVVYYEIYSDRIFIYSVFHTSRDPSEWQSRI